MDLNARSITWSPEQEQIIYREWGIFYTKKQNLDVADLYYNKSLSLNPNDSKALFLRSQCKRRIAQAQGGLVDAEKAIAIDTLSQPLNLEVCADIYELNEFEKTAYHLTNFSRKFSGKKVDAFNNRLDYLGENFNETLGNTLGHFLLGHEATLYKVHKLINVAPDKRPLWKILKQRQECDVLSIPEKELILLPPREIARRQRAFCIFNQIYLQRSWTDLLFLKALQTHQELLLKQSNLSRPILERLTSTKYNIVQTMINMLHARCPLYTKKIFNCPNRTRNIMQREHFLYRIQHQVHRNMLMMLKTMKELRSKGELKKLRAYVEGVMGDYVVLKTHRVMPWKFKFLNEVYNILGLAIRDKLVDIPADCCDNISDSLMGLLKLKKQSEKEYASFEFGPRSSQGAQTASDDEVIELKAFAARLTLRLRFAIYPIERAYLWYELARTELKQNAFDRCCVLAEKSVAEATLCNSHLWKLHGVMMIVRVHAMLRKIEKTKVTLDLAYKIGMQINDSAIQEFLNKCKKQNAKDIHEKYRAERARRFQLSSRTSLRRARMTE